MSRFISLAIYSFGALALANAASITFEEYDACKSVSFEWAYSYDNKDWDRLGQILLPSLNINYTDVMGPQANWPNMTSSEFITLMSGQNLLGNTLVATQHLLGASSWERVSDDRILASYQLRAAHIRFAADESGGRSSQIRTTAHGHAIMRHTYGKNDLGDWKLAGVYPTVMFTEGNLTAISDPEPSK